MRLPAEIHIDPRDPRAPSAEAWAHLTDAERAQVVASLPSEVPDHLFQPAGDWHSDTRMHTQDVLRRYFGRIGRRVYVSGELNVYYPGEAVFAPDALAVVDVPTHRRRSWVVSAEGRGLDFALEVCDAGKREKDFVRNVAWYARLGITEYFVYDVSRSLITAYRLPAGAAAYTRIVPQGGRYLSEVLQVDFIVEDDALRVAPRGGSVLLEAPALIPRLEAHLDAAIERSRAAEAERAEAEAAREAERAAREAERAAREAERAAREAAEAELAMLRARLAELEKGR